MYTELHVLCGLLVTGDIEHFKTLLVLFQVMVKPAQRERREGGREGGREGERDNSGVNEHCKKNNHAENWYTYRGVRTHLTSFGRKRLQGGHQLAEK